jgi:hypothetical protein
MSSRSVVDRQRVAADLIASARTHAQQVGERLQTHLAEPLPDGETLPDFTRRVRVSPPKRRAAGAASGKEG